MYGRNPEDELKLNNFVDDMKKFLARDEFKDFTIKVGDRDFKVHKFVFVVRSDTFAELIKNNPEAEDLVLEDMSLEVFECIMSYVYTDNLPETQNIHEVFAAAGKLKIKGLMNITASKLIKSMDNEKNLEILYKILNFAHKFEHADLRLRAFDGIKKHFPGSQLKDDLARQPEKLKKIIETKLKLEKYLKNLESGDYKDEEGSIEKNNF